MSNKMLNPCIVKVSSVLGVHFLLHTPYMRQWDSVDNVDLFKIKNIQFHPYHV